MLGVVLSAAVAGGVPLDSTVQQSLRTMKRAELKLTHETSLIQYG